MKTALIAATALLTLAGCASSGPKPAAPTPTTSTDTASTTVTIPVVDPNAPITYTVEPFDYDGTLGLTMTVTQDQFGGRMCPCMKIPYPADGMPANNQKGADAIHAAAALMKPGDTLMGFSLGVQVISLALAQHPLPAGVHVLLAGDTLARNAQLVAQGQGIPWDIANDVTMVANEYDGWSDGPDKTGDPNYAAALANATDGLSRLHYYANADPDNPANSVVQQGNIRAVLIPTQHLPQNDVLRLGFNDAAVDKIDDRQRPTINTAYSRPPSTAEQRAAATAEQVPQPNPAWAQNPEPVAAIG